MSTVKVIGFVLACNLLTMPVRPRRGRLVVGTEPAMRNDHGQRMRDRRRVMRLDPDTGQPDDERR